MRYSVLICLVPTFFDPIASTTSSALLHTFTSSLYLLLSFNYVHVKSQVFLVLYEESTELC
jgi:hypothetical protein